MIITATAVTTTTITTISPVFRNEPISTDSLLGLACDDGSLSAWVKATVKNKMIY